MRGLAGALWCMTIPPCCVAVPWRCLHLGKTALAAESWKGDMQAYGSNGQLVVNYANTPAWG